MVELFLNNAVGVVIDVAIQTGIILFKGEPTFHTFAAYGTEEEGDDDYVIVHTDSRHEGGKTFNVHGYEAVNSVIESIRAKIEAEFRAQAEAEMSAAESAAPDEAKS